jgi:hypothetical protein
VSFERDPKLAVLWQLPREFSQKVETLVSLCRQPRQVDQGGPAAAPS